MTTTEAKKELSRLIEIGDDQLIDKMYNTAKSYMKQKRLDRMIAEGEANIEAGRTYSLKEARKIIDDWKLE
jgi:predicted transcriptional regulator